MSKRGYLTAEEYKTLRQILGFTQEEAAKFHRVHNLRTIQRWEKGTSFVSELACDKITALFRQVSLIVETAVNKAIEAKKEHPDMEVTLIVYPDSCYKKYVWDIGNLPNSVHRAMIARVYAELQANDIKCGIVEFNAQDYFSYMGIHGLTDSPDTRSAWAAEYRKKILLN